MPRSIPRAQPPLEFIPPRFNPLVLQVGRSLLPFWLRWSRQILKVEVQNAETLVELYGRFQAGKTRFLLAFRHPSTNDPPCIAQLLWNQLPAIAKPSANRSQPSPHPPFHIHFIYDRGIPLWAGESVGWLVSQLGGTPIRRGSLDTLGLRSIRELFASGKFPIAAAPEGGTNGHNEIVSPIEPGIAQFGFWCIEDLQKAGRSEDVLIVPLGIQYRFAEPHWKSLELLIAQLEQDMGAPSLSPRDAGYMADLQNGIPPNGEQEAILYRRLHSMGVHLLDLMETFYASYYQQSMTSPAACDAAEERSEPLPGYASAANERLAHRLQVLLNAALNVAEQALGIKPKGNLSDRCRRVEQAGWNRIYRDDLKNPESLSAVERGLANLVAEEAHLRIWHMRLVEHFVSVTGKYVAEKPTVERFADTILLIWKMVSQIKGETRTPRPDLGNQYAQITVGQPIPISDRWQDYQTNRRSAIAQVTQELQAALEDMIQ